MRERLLRFAAAVPLVLSITATAAGATKFDVLLPASTTTGVPFSITVTARNGASVDTAYSGTIHFTSDDAGATLPPDYTFLPGDVGTHPFGATFAHAGNSVSTATHTVTATDTSNALLLGVGNSTVTWNAGVARNIRLDYDSTSPTQRTVPFPVTVTMLNVNGDVVPTYRGTVHFGASTAPGDVPPDYTFTAADNGIHSFSFTLSRGGSQSVVVYDTADSSAGVSTQFLVTCPELTVTAGNNGPHCAGETTIIYAASNKNDISQYTWYGSSSFPMSGATVSVVQPGVYTVTAYESSTGCSAMASTAVSVLAVPVPTLSFSKTRVCGHDPVTVTFSNASAYTDIQWGVTGVFVNGGPTNMPSVEVAYVEPNPYLGVDLSARYIPNGCYQYLTSATIPATPVSSTAISTPANVCRGSMQTASVPEESTLGYTVTYAWTASNGAIVSGQGTRIIQFVPTGPDVTLSVTITKDGCPFTGSATVHVNGPTAHAGVQLGICAGDAVSIPVTLDGTPPFNLVWSDGFLQDGIPTTSTSRTVTPTASTQYWITSVSDAHCSGTAEGMATVRVDASPEIVKQPRSASFAPGQSTTLTVESSTTTGARYDWYAGNSGDHSHLVASTPSPSFTTPPLFTTARYWVEVVVPCGSVRSDTATLTVGSRPRPSRH
jgi:hypothetical protein